MRNQKVYAATVVSVLDPPRNPESGLGVLFLLNQPLAESSATMGIRNSLGCDEYHCHGQSK
jgi:hypothetical protein